MAKKKAKTNKQKTLGEMTFRELMGDSFAAELIRLEAAVILLNKERERREAGLAELKALHAPKQVLADSKRVCAAVKKACNCLHW